MSRVATQLGELRDAVGEIGALVARAADSLDHASWSGADDHVWVRDHAAGSLVEIEAATLRVVVTHTSRNLSHAAARLEMAPVSLSRWLGRRQGA